MESIWEILGIEPTQDIQQIKAVYAALSKKYHPEENPEMFMKVLHAYRQAIDLAENNEPLLWDFDDSEQKPQQEQTQSIHFQTEEQIQDQDFWEEQVQQQTWDFTHLSDEEEQIDYENQPVGQVFINLYQGSQRSNAKAWLDYFTSEDFVKVCAKKEFTSFLKEQVLKSELELPKEFISALNCVYGFYLHPSLKWLSSQDSIENPSDILNILDAASKNISMKYPVDNYFAIQTSFLEYFRLVSICKMADWQPKVIQHVQTIINRYDASYIKERCVSRQYSETERHPMGLKLLAYAFQWLSFPEEIYIYTWKSLDLKSAKYGRKQIWYGGIRAAILEKCPSIEEKMGPKFFHLKRLYEEYRQAFNNEITTPISQQLQQALNRFFEEPSLLAACESVTFSCDTMEYWLAFPQHPEFLKQLEKLYQENPQFYQRDILLEELQEKLETIRVAQEREEDDVAPAGLDSIQLSYRPFFRYWLNIAYYDMMESCPELFCHYLKNKMSYCKNWAYQFTKQAKKYRHQIHLFGKDIIEVAFFPLHQEYFINNTPLYHRCLSWDDIANITDNTDFLLLLPLVDWEPDSHREDEILSQIVARFQNAPICEKEKYFLARYFTSDICCRFEEIQKPESTPITVYKEHNEELYGCYWTKEQGELVFFKQTFEGIRPVPEHPVQELTQQQNNYQTVLKLIKQGFGLLLQDSFVNLSTLKILPTKVFIENPLQHPTLVLEQEDITREGLQEEIERFVKTKGRRLELYWEQMGGQSLVILRNPYSENCYACLYFLDGEDSYAALLSKPEIYETVDSEWVEYVPFGRGKLPIYNIFENPIWMVKQLCPLLYMIGFGKLPPASVMVGNGSPEYSSRKYVWSTEVNLHKGKPTYRLQKMKLGGFGVDRMITTQASLQAKFLMPVPPMYMEKISTEETLSSMKISPVNQHLVHLALAQYLQNDIQKLRLSWQWMNDQGNNYQTHIVLLKEEQNYAMLYLNDDREEVHTLVGDVYQYINCEHTPKKTTIQNYTTPIYNIHHDVVAIRYYLDLLLDSMKEQPVLAMQNCTRGHTYDFSDGLDTGKRKKSYQNIRDLFIPKD